MTFPSTGVSMNTAFYIAAVISVLATFLAITRANAVHALLYFIVSLLAMGVICFLLGAPFVAAVVVIINAGAIMVLFLLVIMMLNLGPRSAHGPTDWLHPRSWAGPVVLVLALMLELAYCLAASATGGPGAGIIEPKQVGLSLFGPYALGVELASMLLLAGVLGAYHLGRGISGSKGDHA